MDDFVQLLSAIPDIRIPTGEELYNSLMSRIEPDLTTDQLPLLDQKHKNETPEQAALRADRYDKAFAEYERQLNDYLATLNEKVRQYQRTAQASVEKEDRAEEQQELSSLEDAIGSV